MEPLNLEKKIVITFTGAPGIGKSQLISVMTSGRFTSQYEPTIQEHYTMKLVEGNNIFNLTIVDTSGSPDYSKLASGAIGNSDCIVVCYCPYIPKSFDRVVEVIKEVRTIADDIPIIVVATKMDLKDDKVTMNKIGKQKIRMVKDLKSELKKSKISGFFETSAISGNSYKEILETAIKYTQKSSLWKKKQ
ncbi:GTP-binding protein RHO1 precursor, putative [Entamoeba dispar SAW760]|uniref:small monomeric GTPase n=1 Tax=Entamoeba dispar (strain ATCC PRA-260 / SAW760) TaxID=370354 RepID=B0EF22_ENTDS|nr:GTP-binding protein RHO1 precursor, putative [Entamoeba dispar SAW760]EDR26871.1 GTP-binding protein RHO1 precursor, putative [Entamoeba dispar SAW760]|eukprot:EDR26871.1 GTP-binding protein RHO1 precursor, putative [Entamoeba dispar SAW760]